MKNWRRGRGNKSSWLTIVARQAKLIVGLQAGKTRKEMIAELGVSRWTYWRYMKAVERDLERNELLTRPEPPTPTTFVVNVRFKEKS